MKDKISILETQIFEETDGIKLDKQFKKLGKLMNGETRSRIMELMTRYVREGKVLHFRDFILSDMVSLVEEGDREYAGFFEWSVTQPQFTYWSIDGLLRTMGKSVYPLLLLIAENKKETIEVRGKAVKELALFSRNTFDRGLPSDPGQWKESDLRMEEILQWKEEGYPDGQGYAALPKHPSLQDPKTRLERAAARLDKKLTSQQKKKKSDPANRENQLTIAKEEEMQKIENTFHLPENYTIFLRHYSPWKVYIDNEEYPEQIHLYGAVELLDNQNGYSYNPVKKEKITEWPDHFVVIADAGADPFCMDASAVSDGDAPVYWAEHGVGEWNFELYAESFLDFLESL